jgi:hypothetical protein
MANHALAALETALRARKLDRTLTTALPPLERIDPAALVPTAIERLDSQLQGGIPRGQLSELVGPLTSGRTTLLLQTAAAATRRGELAAIVDTFDRLDVASAAAAGVDLARLLWIRLPASGPPSFHAARHAGADDAVDRAVGRALKALNLVLQAGGFALVALDFADVPASVLKRIPFTTWLRVQRIIEGSDTACVLVAAEPVARSAGGLTLTLRGRALWMGATVRSRCLTGIDVGVRVVSPRRRVDGECQVRCAEPGLPV